MSDEGQTPATLFGEPLSHEAYTALRAAIMEFDPEDLPVEDAALNDLRDEWLDRAEVIEGHEEVLDLLEDHYWDGE